METFDELVTPGCPNCVVKHLSCAIALLAENRMDTLTYNGGAAQSAAILLERAVVNLGETAQGYGSHYAFAVGLLAQAERQAILESWTPDEVAEIRAARLDLVERGPEGAAAVMRRVLDKALATDCVQQAIAHLIEARREAPDGVLDGTGAGIVPAYRSDLATVTVACLVETVHRVRKEFFDFDQGEKPAEEKGEEHMATAKKAPAKAAAKKAAPAKAAAKKAPAKAATKAACKGGKTKKGK